MTTSRLQPKDVKVYAMENCGKNRSAGRIGGMVNYAAGSPLVVASYTDTILTLDTNTTYEATKALSAEADAGSGRTTFTCATQTYIAGDVIEIASTSAYNGIYTIYSVPGVTSFTIDKVFVSDEGATGTAEKRIASYKGAAIGANTLIGCWVTIRGAAGNDVGWTMYQITANSAFNTTGATITVNNLVTGPGLLKSDTTGYGVAGTADVYIYITEYPILGRQTLIGTDYGPFFLKSISTTTITEGFASGLNMVADVYNSKYLMFLSGKYRGKSYEIDDTSTTAIVLKTTIGDATGIGALTWRDKVWFRIMDKVALADGVSFDLPFKNEIGVAKNSSGTKNMTGGSVMVEGTLEVKSYEQPWLQAAMGGVMKDTSNNYHLLIADMDNYTPNAATGNEYTQDGYDVKYQANRTPSGRTDGTDGWPLNHCAPPDHPHIMFIRYKHKSRNNSLSIKTIYEDVMLVADGGDGISATSDDVLTQKFKLIAKARDCYDVDLQA